MDSTAVLTRCIHPVHSASVSIPLTLLGLLEREPSHGYDLKRDYDAYFGRGKPLAVRAGVRDARLGSPATARSSRRAPNQVPGPDRKRYVITEQGVSELETWLAEPVAPEPHLQTVLFVKVVLALHVGPLGGAVPGPAAGRAPPTDARAHGAEAHRVDLVDALLADHGLFHLEADLRWIELTAARLDALAEEVRT